MRIWRNGLAVGATVLLAAGFVAECLAAPPAAPAPRVATVSAGSFQVLALSDVIEFANLGRIAQGGVVLRIVGVDGSALEVRSAAAVGAGRRKIAFVYEITTFCDTNGRCDTSTEQSTLEAELAPDGRYSLVMACQKGGLAALLVEETGGASRNVAWRTGLPGRGLCRANTVNLG